MKLNEAKEAYEIVRKQVISEAAAVPKALDTIILDMLDQEIPKKKQLKNRIDRELKFDIEDNNDDGNAAGYEWNQKNLSKTAESEMMEIVAEAMERVVEKLGKRIDSWNLNVGSMLFKHGSAVLRKEYPVKEMDAAMKKKFKKK